MFLDRLNIFLYPLFRELHVKSTHAYKLYLLLWSVCLRTEKSFFEKTGFTVANSFLYLSRSEFGFGYSGVGQRFEYSTPFALAGF